MTAGSLCQRFGSSGPGISSSASKPRPLLMGLASTQLLHTTCSPCWLLLPLVSEHSFTCWYLEYLFVPKASVGIWSICCYLVVAPLPFRFAPALFSPALLSPHPSPLPLLPAPAGRCKRRCSSTQTCRVCRCSTNRRGGRPGACSVLQGTSTGAAPQGGRAQARPNTGLALAVRSTMCR